MRISTVFIRTTFRSLVPNGGPSLSYTRVSGTRSFLGKVAIWVWFPEDSLFKWQPHCECPEKVFINDDDKVSKWICSCWPRPHGVSFLFSTHLNRKQMVNQKFSLLIKDFSEDLGRWEACAASICARETFVCLSHHPKYYFVVVSAALRQAVDSTL